MKNTSHKNEILQLAKKTFIIDYNNSEHTKKN